MATTTLVGVGRDGTHYYAPPHAHACNASSPKNVLQNVHLYLGPTNSAKTFEAINLLSEAPNGAFVAPLRMLAQEVFNKLKDIVGPESVGLITGEERINANARIICCTAECTPPTGDVLVVDEAHWLVDKERGHVWTRILRGRGYREMCVIAAKEAEELLKKAFSDVQDVHVHHKTRINELDNKVRIFEFSSMLPKAALPAAFVAFSRKAVLSMARALKGLGHNPAVVYGSLPPEARKAEIDRLVSGECDVICCTDVIGHGVNLPLQSVVMCDTRKFDGVAVRDVMIWEAAQIVGRAGRGDAKGTIYAGKNHRLGVSADVGLVRRAVDAANGKSATDLDLKKATMFPRFDDLKTQHAVLLLAAYDAWGAKAFDQDWLEAQK